MKQFSNPIIKSEDYLFAERKILQTHEQILDAMEKVALLSLEKVLDYISLNPNPLDVVLLVGKGNNGADALALGRHLIKTGIKVLALEFFEDSRSEFLKIQKENFLGARGELISLEEFFLMKDLLIIDGVFGSGFKGSLDKKTKMIFEFVNLSRFQVISLDAPSGVSGDFGAALGSIKADVTLYIDYPRWGFFLDDAPNFLGELIPICLDCVPLDVVQHKIQGYLIDKEDLYLPEMKRKRHKYEAGLVAGFCGSSGMSGALNLSGLASLKVGAGIVKFIHYLKLHLIVNELIIFSLGKAKKILRSAKALMMGPGTSRGYLAKFICRCLIKLSSCPVVIDADAIYNLKKKHLRKIKSQSVITPHRKECLDMLALDMQTKDENLFKKIEEYLSDSEHLVLLKGVPTILFGKNIPKLVIYGGSPGMATAGAGDVLTGMIAGFIAQRMELVQAVCLAVYLHQKAGEIAALDLTAYSLTASSLIERIPDAIFLLRQN